jgi:hypothetical protein
MKWRAVGAERFHADGQTDRQTDGLTDRHGEANSRLKQPVDTRPDCRLHNV